MQEKQSKLHRSNREVKDLKEIKQIIDTCKVIRVATKDAHRPYIVPLNFGYSYEGGIFTFYFHSAKSGRLACVGMRWRKLAFIVVLWRSLAFIVVH